MATQLSASHFDPVTRNSMSSYELAAAFGSRSSLQPSSSSYHSLAGLDPFASGLDSGSGSPFQGSTQGVHPSHSSSSALSAANDVQAAFHPSAYPNANTLAFHQALADAFVSAHIQQQQQQRPVSPHSQYTNLRWPAAGHMNHLGLEPMDPLFAPASTQPLFPPSLAAHSVYQSHNHGHGHGHGQPTQTLQDHQQAAAQPSWSVTGSLDPVTGVYQRVPEHPRMRTAQACEKCRVRKAKCSGEHPTCARCRMRGLVCEYAPERKMRGPNKVKRKSVGVASTSTSNSSGSRSDRERRASSPSADERKTSDASTSSDPDPNYRFPEHGDVDAKPVASSPVPRIGTPVSEPGHTATATAEESSSSPLRFPVGTSPHREREHEHEQEAHRAVRRAGPQSIDLGSAVFFAPHHFPHPYQHESMHEHEHEHSQHQHQPYTPQPVHLLPPIDYSARRQSLPEYVHMLALNAHAHAHAAQRAQGQGQGQGLDALGLDSHSGRRSGSGSGSHSGSESEGMAPPTPLELPESLLGGEMMYPEIEMGMRMEQAEMQFGDDSFKLPEPMMGMGMEMGMGEEMGRDEEQRGDMEVPIDPALLAE